LAYFDRDLHEMIDSAFMKDPPATLEMFASAGLSPVGDPKLKTPATHEEIRSFVTIFRRLYMKGESGSFQNAAAIFVKALGGHPYGKLVEGSAKEFEAELAVPPDGMPFVKPGAVTFTTKRLLDVFIYTQYAHQPDADRQRQFGECLAQVQGKLPVLTWLFLGEIWGCALQLKNAGKIISWWFKVYCDHHKISPDVLDSLTKQVSGLGAGEKEKDRQARLFQEKVEKLAQDLWEQNGRSAGGPAQFLAVAKEELTKRLGG
jgi:hypothetical protein